jgi:small subunit ribosomal protein S17
MVNMMKKKKTIGLDVKEPKEICESELCPWHGNLKVRGRIFKGRVTSTKPMNTVIVEWDYFQKVPKYERYERRKTSVAAHSPECIKISKGDTVTIAECRPLSKTKKFVVVEKDGD